MTMNTFKYYVDSPEFKWAWEIESSWDEDNLDWVAQDCAEDYHGNHDGWESSWPINFYIFTLGGKLIGSFEVEREHVPAFSATPIEKKRVTK